jgi:hypothetical protein
MLGRPVSLPSLLIHSYCQLHTLLPQHQPPLPSLYGSVGGGGGSRAYPSDGHAGQVIPGDYGPAAEVITGATYDHGSTGRSVQSGHSQLLHGYALCGGGAALNGEQVSASTV